MNDADASSDSWTFVHSGRRPNCSTVARAACSIPVHSSWIRPESLLYDHDFVDGARRNNPILQFASLILIRQAQSEFSGSSVTAFSLRRRRPPSQYRTFEASKSASTRSSSSSTVATCEVATMLPLGTRPYGKRKETPCGSARPYQGIKNQLLPLPLRSVLADLLSLPLVRSDRVDVGGDGVVEDGLGAGAFIVDGIPTPTPTPIPARSSSTKPRAA